MKIRTRFAPSPTGFLHIGGLRTALFAYLVAKSQGGDFILRIEDTDQKRKVKGSAEQLLSILEWAGIKTDESPLKPGKYGPYIQSERQKIYDKYKKELLDKGKAYPCFCSAERLQEMRQKQQANKQAPRYDRTCRSLSSAEVNKKIEQGLPYVIRQKMPIEGDIMVKDELRGEIKINAKELDDHVLIKSDGMPTYQFASVVDDHLMEITHVTRAEEWIPSFPKNILLYQAFGWEPPKFIHLPVVLNKEGGKLSKRQDDVAVEDYRDKGYLPEGLINFCALLGWSPYTKENQGQAKNGKNIEILNLNEIITQFNYQQIGTSPAIFDIEKLDFFNGYHIRQKSTKDLLLIAKPFLQKNFGLSEKEHKKDDDFLLKVIKLDQERLKKLSDITESTAFVFKDKLDIESDMLAWKKMEKEAVKPNLEKIIDLLDNIPERNWTNDSIEEAIISYIKATEGKIGEYLWPMRVALSGRKASPGPFDIAETLGKNETILKINDAIKSL